MTNVIDYILLEISLDDRVSGIFNMDKDSHMDVLREYLIKNGIPTNESIQLTNRMLEGKYPERQAYNVNGILCTFPSPEYKSNAIKRGTHFEKNPIQSAPAPKEPTEKPIEAPAQPISAPINPPTPSVEQEPVNIPNIFKNAHPLEAEPENAPKTNSKAIEVSPQTPQQIAASKEVIKQIINGENSFMTTPIPTLNLSEECLEQLKTLYTTAYKMELHEAVSFLTHYVKP